VSFSEKFRHVVLKNNVYAYMKNIIDLILSLANQDINIYVENGKLKVNAPNGVLENDVIKKIKTHREELIEYLLSTGDKITNEIPQTTIKESYLLSSSQRRLWVLSQFEEGSLAYNIPGVYVFEGDLNMAALEYAFKMLIARHEILRTVFKEVEDGGIRQFIHSPENATCRIVYQDLRQENEQELRLKKMVGEAISKPFNLAAGPLLRADLYQVADNKWIFSYTMHHIISDAWSMDILIKELLLFYNAYAKGEGGPLSPLRIQYKDYAAWQQEQLMGEGLKDHKSYWLKQFEGELPVLQLAGDKVRPAVKTYNGGTISKHFNARLSKGLNALTKEQGGTLFMGLLAIVNTLLYRYTHQDDIIIGSSIASREHADLEDQIGFYVNTLALRTQFKGKDSWRELLSNIKQVTLGAYEHQVYPFDELVNELNLQRDISRSSLFDVMVVLQNAGTNSGKGSQSLGNIKVSGYDTGEAVISKFDLTFFFAEAGEALQVNIVYNKDIYSKSTVARLADHLEQLLEAVIANPSQSIDQLDYLSREEKQQLSVTFAESKVGYPKDRTVVRLFEEQVSLTPDATALVFEGQALTYRTLNDQSNKLANYLLTNCHLAADDLTGIMLDRSANMIIAILGVLKSGGAYVAIEPDTPRARKEFIIKDTGIKALITQTDYVFDLDYYGGHVFAIDIQLDGIDTSEELSKPNIQPKDLAYVIYTSGSTGEPKGVMITHQSVIDYSFGVLDRTNIRDCKSFGLVSTIAADLGNTVIYPSLLTGGTLHVFSERDVMDGDQMQAANLDCIKIVPSHWKALQEGSRLFAPKKCLIFGGEQLTSDVIEYIRLHKGSCEVYNHYGPSETTIGKLINHIDIDNAGATISLGTPFCNSCVYILDGKHNLQPIGVAGEICIGGEGLARGYLKRDDLTAERFVANPFKTEERIYKTGDLGRWLADGTIAFLGRKDDQVKIRGYRIELGEIENTLKNHPSIENAIVLARTAAGGDKELVAYVVNKEALSKDDLQTYLSKSLPAYMLPGYYVPLITLPLTPNGKVDRKRLPDPEGLTIEPGDVYVSPDTNTEEQLVKIWEEILGQKQIGVQTSFFNLGGNSLKIIKMSQMVNQQFGVSFSIDKLFEYLTIRDLARALEQEKRIENEKETTEKEAELINF
jgi:amino acid adenylation domain-containing protein